MCFQNDLKMLFTSLADNKYIVLYKLAEAAERPAKEQMQVNNIYAWYAILMTSYYNFVTQSL